MTISVFIASFVMPATAHSPSSMNVTYNMETEELSVEITHQVANGNTHYVKNIIVTINGETVIDQNYSSQSGNTFSLVFKNVTADIDDVIVVVASCNQGGSITKELTVSSNGTTSPTSDSTPGFEMFLLVSALTGAILYYKRKM